MHLFVCDEKSLASIASVAFNDTVELVNIRRSMNLGFALHKKKFDACVHNYIYLIGGSIVCFGRKGAV